MSKPLFSTDGWCLPSSIAEESNPKSKAGSQLKDQSSKTTSNPLERGSTQSTTSVSSSLQPNLGSKSSKKRKKRKLEVLKAVEPKLLNLGDNTQGLKIKQERATQELKVNQQRTGEVSSKPVVTNQSHRPKRPQTTQLNGSLTPLQEKMTKKLQGAKFRIINEMLYTLPSDQAFQKFQSEPDLFEEYHTGFRTQVEAWPTNPIDLFINYFKTNAKPDMVIADMGCGEAELASKLPESVKVHSFDLVAANPRITACDISHTPLGEASIDAVVFSLSLMGTNYQDFIMEARRILKAGGELKIAEVISRFENLDAFINYIAGLGFQLARRDESNKMFVMLDFIKDPKAVDASKEGKTNAEVVDSDVPTLEVPVLKPCVYKRR